MGTENIFGTFDVKEKVAQDFARAAHRNQLYDGVPYADGHLSRVVYWLHNVIISLDLPEICAETHSQMLQAAWLHDTMEDTDTTADDLLAHFDKRVVDMVQALTDEPGPYRATRKALTYHKQREAGREVVAIKLADRIANTIASRLPECTQSFLRMYRDEFPGFKAALRTRGELERTWDILEKLTFG